MYPHGDKCKCTHFAIISVSVQYDRVPLLGLIVLLNRCYGVKSHEEFLSLQPTNTGEPNNKSHEVFVRVSQTGVNARKARCVQIFLRVPTKVNRLLSCVVLRGV